MKTGDVILIPFPFSELTNRKVRPCVVICKTRDKYRDLVLSAITSVIPKKMSDTEILIAPDSANNLRTTSVIKVDRIVTAKKEDTIAHIGELSIQHKKEFIKIFKSLVD